MPRKRTDRDSVWLAVRPENGYWEARWYDPAKRKVRRRSTGTRDRAEAERLKAKWIIDGGIGDAAHRPSGPRPAGAQASSPRLADTLNNYLIKHAAHLPSRQQAAIAVRHLLAYFGEIAIDRLDKVAQQGYVTHRWKAGIKARTISRELSVLRAALYLLRDDDPLISLPFIYEVEVPPPRDRYLDEAELGRLLKHCKSKHLRLFVFLAIYTAARPGAILDLTWDRVDLRAGVINLLPPGKAQTNKRRPRVKITPPLRKALLAARKKRRASHVIEYDGRPIRSIDTAFRATAREAGFAPGDVTPKLLRHTAATWMAQRGVSLWDIAHYLGNVDTRMVEKHYAHHHPDYQKKAARALTSAMSRVKVAPHLHPRKRGWKKKGKAQTGQKPKGIQAIEVVGAARIELATPTMST